MINRNEIQTIEREHITTKERVKYLLEKYSIKTQNVSHQRFAYPASDRNQYIDEDPNFLPFYSAV